MYNLAQTYLAYGNILYVQKFLGHANKNYSNLYQQIHSFQI
jgi:hypothetical protein